VWVRKPFDIGWSDLAWAALFCLSVPNRDSLTKLLENDFSPAGDAIACLSIRSGFDAWLSAVNFPAGGEIIVSAITIPDMLRIIREHGLVPIPMDVDQSNLAVAPAQLAAALSPRTRAILVAHLFGSRQPLGAIAELAHLHGLLVVEDCAQAFEGRDHLADPLADVSMFSFGPIKTATALGGGLLIVRDSSTRDVMRAALASAPSQSRGAYLRRVVKYSAMKTMSMKHSYSWFIAACRLLGKDPDLVASGAVRGFAGDDFFQRIRKRPSTPLIAVMRRRISQARGKTIAARKAHGAVLVSALPSDVVIPGSRAASNSFWVFPIIAPDSARLVEVLRAAGFDATSAHSLCLVDAPDDRPDLQPAIAAEILRNVFYLPAYTAIPVRELERMAAVITGFR
jgi:perosamine synthetase